MGKYITTYINKDTSAFEYSIVPDRAVNYLKCLKVDTCAAVSYEENEYVEAEFSYKGRKLDVSLEDEYTDNPKWHLKSEKKDIAIFSERAITFSRMNTKNDFDYHIIVSRYQNGMSIALWSMLTGINSLVSVVQDLYGNININLTCMGPRNCDESHNMWSVNIYQPVGKQFYMPRYYLEELKKSIDADKYFRCCDKNGDIKKDSEEIRQEIDLLTTITSDSKFVEVLNALMGYAPQKNQEARLREKNDKKSSDGKRNRRICSSSLPIDLPNGESLATSGSVKIKTRFKRIKENL